MHFRRELQLDTDEGPILIGEDDLPTITEKELVRFRISRKDLHRCFKQGMKLMAGYTISDRIRPCASETLAGKWEVYLCRYSAWSDPLMQVRRPKGSYKH
jgi:hypothetical protein